MILELKLLKSKVVLIVALVGFQFLHAQIAPEKYWIQFTDKDTSNYSVNTPVVYLSQRAIDRRVNQGIAVTPQDFPVNQQYIDSVKQTANVTVLIKSKWMNGIAIQTTDTLGLAQILALNFVDSANSRSVWVESEELSEKMMIQGRVVENEYSNTFGAEGLNYGLATHQIEMLSIDYIHDLGFTGAGMVIAVLDAGFKGADTTEILQSMWANNQVLGTWDFVLGQPIDYANHSSHGKYVLNCMAANKSGRYIGTAPDAEYWLLRTEDAPTENIIEEYNWVAGAEFADSVGADVFNTSLGYTTFDDSTKDHTYADMDGKTTVITIGADIAASKGILVVNSAGNSGSKNWHYIGAPADGDSVLSIGAVRYDSVAAGFSSKGPSVDGRVKPNVMALGEGVPMPWDADSIFYINGTSFSGPILAGSAASFWQSRSGYNNMEVYHAIEQSATLYTNPNDSMGYGIPNFKFAYFLITGVKEVQNTGLSVQAYPNPTTGYAYIPVPENKQEAVFVTDASGRQILQLSNPSLMEGTVRIDLSSYPKGIYLVQVKSGVGVQIVRVVKE